MRHPPTPPSLLRSLPAVWGQVRHELGTHEKTSAEAARSCPHRGCHPVTAASLGPGWGVSRPRLCLASSPQSLKAARQAAGPQLEGEGWTGTSPVSPKVLSRSQCFQILPPDPSPPSSRGTPSLQSGRIWITGATAWDPQTQDLEGSGGAGSCPGPPRPHLSAPP